MAMLKPPHPGLLLQEELLDRGLTVAQAATGLGVTRQQLHKVIKGQSAVSPEMALRLERASAAAPTSGSGCRWLSISPVCGRGRRRSMSRRWRARRRERVGR